MESRTLFYSSIEMIDKKELKELQLKRLRETVQILYDKNLYFGKKLRQAKVKPSDIIKLDDLSKIPFTTKDDLRVNYPTKLVNVGLDQVVRFHVSSGTTGDPTVVAYTESDIDRWSELNARCLAMMGVKRGDIIQIAYGYGLFTGGLGIHYGAERLGISIIPSSAGNTKRQIKLIRDMHATVLACTPSYALYIAETAIQEGLEPKKDLNLRVGVFGAEPWSESVRKRLIDQICPEPYDIYGLSELCGPGVAAECHYRNGLHVWADNFIPEIIDPKTGEVLEPGEEGELVFTTINKEAMPLLRYRTRDVSRMDFDTCSCGRTHPRILRIRGRSDDMMKIRGVNVFPSQIEYVLQRMDELGDQYQIVLTKLGPLDDLKVKVEVKPSAVSDKPWEMVGLKKRVEDEIRSVLNLNLEVDLVEPGSLPRSEGKAKRVLDLRGQA
ncbi:MAG: phenylacetate--CoA ligase [Nitrososphaerales archaeon]|nr:phenylacetate--CoA ligase [Nitrososphaerales archaeon]